MTDAKVTSKNQTPPAAGHAGWCLYRLDCERRVDRPHACNCGVGSLRDTVSRSMQWDWTTLDRDALGQIQHSLRTALSEPTCAVETKLPQPQPIETAPTGGKWMLGWWPEITDCWVPIYRVYGRWHCPVGTGYDEGTRYGKPALWHPLPALPDLTEKTSASLLRPPSTHAPPGCHCQTQCMAPVVMGRQTPCRDPEKAATFAIPPDDGLCWIKGCQLPKGHKGFCALPQNGTVPHE